MDQNKFVLWANKQHQFVDETFEDAHFPLPKDLGTETIKLHHLDHAIQGLFQSEEVGKKCFFVGDTKAALNAPNYFPLGWFEAWDLYDKWSSKTSCCDVSARQRKEWSKIGGQVTGARDAESGKLDEMRLKANEVCSIPVKVTFLETGKEKIFKTMKQVSFELKVSRFLLLKAFEGDGVVRSKWRRYNNKYKVEKV